jgi:hypothetical protein
MDLQIVGEHRVSGKIGDHAETRRCDHHRDDGKAVESVGEVHRIARADNDEHGKQHEEPAEVEHRLLQERKYQRGGERRVTEPNQREAGKECNGSFDDEPDTAAKTLMRLLGHFQIIVVEAHQPEAERHPQHDPDVRIGRVCPQKRRHQHPGQDHQSAHGRRSGLGDNVRFRTVSADRLSLSLQEPQPVDDLLPK